ncbi:MAG: ABC transporter ATP-binding protein [Defluviitaleaceae bacterium]|nr:ABC transporter ATP-binding protein [Defluviitaleaceae bacterium]
MITLNNVSAGYGSGDIIKNISMEINGNLSIVGPNGCGKTTLLKVIAGLLPCSGSLEVFGRPISKMKRQQVAENIAMLSQQPTIYFEYSVFDTVMMGRYVHIKKRGGMMPDKEDKEAVFRSLLAVDLADSKDKSIAKLSGGQLQRVFLARALAQEPKIILLDEPTNHLDLKCQVDIIEHLNHWSAESGRIVVGVLHDINLAMALSPTMAVMKGGEIYAMGKTTDIVANGALNQAYQMDVKAHMVSTFSNWST